MKKIDIYQAIFTNGLILLFISILSGCGPLSKTQVSTVKKYQSIMGNYPGYPLLLNEMTADMSYRRALLFPEDWLNSASNVSNLQAFDDYRSEIGMNDHVEMKSGLNELGKYQDDFLYLFPNIYESHDFVEKSLSDLSIGIPLVGKSLVNVAVRSKKAVYNEPQIKRNIKQHVIKGEELVRRSTQIMKPFIDRQIKQIKQEQTRLNQSYLQDSNDENTSRYILQAYQDNYRTLNLYIFNLEKISSELLKSADLWQETHFKLIALLGERKKIGSFQELIELQESINRIEFFILNANRYKD